MTFSNSDISKSYRVSLPAVNAWIKNSKLGKNNLALRTANKKLQVIDNENNRAELKRLSELGKRYKTNKAILKHTVSNQFYDIFSIEEQIEIVNDLEFRHMVNQKFMYKGNGAKDWDHVYHHQQKDLRYSNLKFLEGISEIVRQVIDQGKLVNIVDLGAGNAYPAKVFLEKFQNVTKAYVPADISLEMLEIAKQNIINWYPELSIVPYQIDFERSRIDRILVENKDLKLGTNNLLLFLGLTFSNQTEQTVVLNNIRVSMQPGDLLIFDAAMENPESLTSFKNVKYTEEERKYAWIFRLLGIDPEECEINLRFDELERRKLKTYKLLKDYRINLNLLGQEKVIELTEGTELTRWQSYQFTVPKLQELLDSCRLKIVSFSYVYDRSNAVIVCEVR